MTIMCVAPSSESSYILYPRRWLVLGSFSLLTMSSTWIWISWSPIAALAAELWDETADAVDALSGIYMYVYVLCSFLSLYLVVNHIGLHRGLIVGGMFNVAGAAVRYLCLENYRHVYVGTLLCAIAQTFTLSTPPLIAASWFGASERATATSLGVVANQLGTTLGMGSTIFLHFVDEDVAEGVHRMDLGVLESYLGIQLFVAALALLLVVLFCADRPVTPPSLAAAETGHHDWLVLTERKEQHDSVRRRNEEAAPLLSSQSGSRYDQGEQARRRQQEVESTTYDSIGYAESIKIVTTDPKHVAFVVAFGMSVGVYYTIPTFLSQLLPPSWKSQWIGWLGCTYQAAGMVGSLVSGLVVDRTGQPRRVCRALLLSASLFLFLLAMFVLEETPTRNGSLSVSAATALPVASSGCAFNDIGIVVAVAFSGMALAAWNSVGMEFGAALTYPANEAAVAGVLECAAELLGFFWVCIGGNLVLENEHAAFTGVLFCAAVASVLLFGWSHGESKRPGF